MGGDRGDELLAWMEADDDTPPPPKANRHGGSVAGAPKSETVPRGDPESEARTLLPPPPPPRPDAPPKICARCGARDTPLRRDSPGDMICRKCWDDFYKGSRKFDPDDEPDWSHLGPDANRFRGTRTRAFVSRRVEVTEGKDGGSRTKVHYDVTEKTEEVVGGRVLPTVMDGHGQRACVQSGSIKQGKLEWGAQDEVPEGVIEAERLKEEGNAKLTRGDIEGAVELYRQASALQPDNHVYHGNAAQALQELRRLEEAEEAAKRSVELAPSGWWKGHLRLAHILFLRRDFPSARVALEKAISQGAPRGDAVSQLSAAIASCAQPPSAPPPTVSAPGSGAGAWESALEVRDSKEKGKYAVALRAFSPGDVVFTDTPLCVAKLDDFSSLLSDFAKRTPREQEAALSLYCPLDDHRMPEQDREGLAEAARKVWAKLGAEEKAAMGGDDVRLARLMGINNCNALGRQERGVCCLYELACRLEHSCVPNLVYYMLDDLTVRFTAVRPVAPGDALSFEYISGYAPREERQAALLRDYYFSCACPSCCGMDIARRFDCQYCHGRVSPLHALGGGIGSWRCDDCGREAAADDIQSHKLMERYSKQLLDHSADGGKLDVQVMRSEGFNKTHWLLREVAQRQAKAAAGVRNWERCEECLGYQAEAEEGWYPAHHPARAACLEMLGQVVAEQGRKEEAREFYKQAAELVAQGYGEDTAVACRLRKCAEEAPGVQQYARLAAAAAAAGRAGQTVF